MKKIISLLLIIFFWKITTAQQQITKTFTVENIKVIHKQTNKDVISIRLFIKGGALNYTKENEGIENILLNLMISGGTTTKDKAQFNDAAEKIGMKLNSSSSFDFSEINMTCIQPFFDASWDLFADAIVHPALPASEYDLLQKQLMTAAGQRASNPDAHLRDLAMQSAFEGNHYATIPDGTVASLQKISLDELKKHYQKIINKQNIFLVVVGNISEAVIQEKIKKYLATIPNGKTAVYPLKKHITQPGIFIEDRAIATNYIRGIMDAPKMSTDGIAMRIAMSILRDRYFVELRTKRSLTYAPQAAYATLAILQPYSIIYASTQKPKEAIEVMIQEINDIKSKGFKDSELENEKTSSVTQYFMGLQTAESQSYNLGMAELWGDVNLAEQYAEKVKKLTVKELNRVFDKYTDAIRWTYLGKKSDVNETDFLQAKPVEPKYKPY